jgi:hypothetical protein
MSPSPKKTDPTGCRRIGSAVDIVSGGCCLPPRYLLLLFAVNRPAGALCNVLRAPRPTIVPVVPVRA